MPRNVEPLWQDFVDFKAGLPKALYDCFTTQQSLTSYLKRLGDLDVQVMQEGQKSENIWQRTVVLLLNQMPVIVGHSEIPTKAFADPQLQSLQNLGNRPLGEVIFTELKGERESLEFACLTSVHYLFQLASSYLSSNPNNLYARRSVIKVSGYHLLIHEIFLPERSYA